MNRLVIAMVMQLAATDAGPLKPEPEVFEGLLDLDHKHILELGCGAAHLTRLIAEAGDGRRVTALEVDRIQHDKNLAIDDLPNVHFDLAGAEAIPLDDASVDLVFMFKSLHHVPVESMDQAMTEIARVLRPRGLLYVSEPIYAGAFNDILKLFNDEQRVREAAFAAVQAAVQRRLFTLEKQVFFRSPVRFADFAEFERRIIGATHSEFKLSPETYAAVKGRFVMHQTAEGAQFEQPIRVDLLQRPA
jgi:SAM-dependent methyltransferase